MFPPYRGRFLRMPDAAGVGITAAAALFGQPGCDCCGSALPCTTPACLAFPTLPCYAGKDYSIEITGPAPSSAVVYSGRICALPPGPTFPCFGSPSLGYGGVYSWSISGWPSGYTPSATSGTFTATCGGFIFLPLTWSLADPASYCPCPGPANACDTSAFPPVATTGNRTLTNRLGTVTLSPYPASSPLVVHYFGGSDTYRDVWAGLQTVTACSVAATCCDGRLVGSGDNYPGTATILWVFGCKSSGLNSLCGLRAYTMGCHCSGLSGVMYSAGSFDNSGIYPETACENANGTCTRTPVAIPLINASPAAGSTASPFLYDFPGVLARLPSATIGKPIPSYLGSCDPYATGTGYADYYVGDTTVTL